MSAWDSYYLCFLDVDDDHVRALSKFSFGYAIVPLHYSTIQSSTPESGPRLIVSVSMYH